MDTEKLKSALKENTHNYTVSQKTEWENSCALFNLLIDHPVFNDRVAKARNELSLPPQSIYAQEDAVAWEHKNLKNRDTLRITALKVIKDFKIPTVFYNDTVNFTYDYILCKERVSNLLLEEFNDEEWKDEFQDMVSKKVLTARLIHTTRDLELNKYLIEPNALYLQISPTIGNRDFIKAYKQIKKLKKIAQPFRVPKPQGTMRMIWRLRSSGKTPKEIILMLKEKFIGTKTQVDNHFIDVNTQRYKKALKKLHPIR